MNITNIGKPVVLEEIQAVDVSALSPVHLTLKLKSGILSRERKLC